MRSRSVANSAITYIAFAGTGFGSALPGVLLPELIRAWHLSDLHAGSLFLLLWLGSATGALVVRGRPTSIVALGCGAVALGAFGFAWLGGAAAAPASFLHGLGLGMTMTAISMLRQHVRADRRGLELLRLNLMWSAGALAAPLLAVRALRNHAAPGVLAGEAVFFAVISVWAFTAGAADVVLPNPSGFSRASWRKLGLVPLPLVLATIAVPGMEAASGGWLATYAARASHSLAATVAAPACLWAGSLASRLVGSTPRVERAFAQHVTGLLGCAAVAAVAMVAVPASALILAGAAVLGFALGPLYPLLLARVMAREEVPTIFFLAGVSASAVPWITGAAATWGHSLRVGMGAVAAIGVAAFMLNWSSERSRTARPSPATG